MSTSEDIQQPLEELDAGSADTAIIANEYVKGFNSIIGGKHYESPSDIKRPRLDDGNDIGTLNRDSIKARTPSFMPPELLEPGIPGKYGKDDVKNTVINTYGSYIGTSDRDRIKARTSSFMPPELLEPGVTGKDDIKDVKKAVINAYLDSCSNYVDYTETHNETAHSVYNEERCEDGDFSNVSSRPTDNKFWRDGEEIRMNDGDDGLSTDFRVRSVFSSIIKTLNLFSECGNNATPTIKWLKRTLNVLEHDIRVINSNEKAEKRYMQVISTIKTLVLKLDTSKGFRKVVANQMDPVTCYLPKDAVRRLCRFNGFGSVGDYGYLECKFIIPIKLIFLGNLETKCYQDSESGGNIVYNIELCSHFGTYFYEFLENIYDVCFDILREEVQRYQEKEALKSVQRDTAIMQVKAGDMSSLMRLKSSGAVNSDQVTTSRFLDNLRELSRRDHIRILGTSGKKNSGNRLCYTGYDSNRRTVTENDPQEDVDAIFVSSFIRFRIHREGDVYMDVYTRNALRLEMEIGNDNNN